jgi:hypothetical protein
LEARLVPSTILFEDLSAGPDGLYHFTEANCVEQVTGMHRLPGPGDDLVAITNNVNSMLVFDSDATATATVHSFESLAWVTVDASFSLNVDHLIVAIGDLTVNGQLTAQDWTSPFSNNTCLYTINGTMTISGGEVADGNLAFAGGEFDVNAGATLNLNGTNDIWAASPRDPDGYDIHIKGTVNIQSGTTNFGVNTHVEPGAMFNVWPFALATFNAPGIAGSLLMDGGQIDVQGTLSLGSGRLLAPGQIKLEQGSNLYFTRGSFTIDATSGSGALAPNSLLIIGMGTITVGPAGGLAIAGSVEFSNGIEVIQLPGGFIVDAGPAAPGSLTIDDSFTASGGLDALTGPSGDTLLGDGGLIVKQGAFQILGPLDDEGVMFNYSADGSIQASMPVSMFIGAPSAIFVNRGFDLIIYPGVTIAGGGVFTNDSGGWLEVHDGVTISTGFKNKGGATLELDGNLLSDTLTLADASHADPSDPNTLDGTLDTNSSVLRLDGFYHTDGLTERRGGGRIFIGDPTIPVAGTFDIGGDANLRADNVIVNGAGVVGLGAVTGSGTLEIGDVNQPWQLVLNAGSSFAMPSGTLILHGMVDNHQVEGAILRFLGPATLVVGTLINEGYIVFGPGAVPSPLDPPPSGNVSINHLVNDGVVDIGVGDQVHVNDYTQSGADSVLQIEVGRIDGSLQAGTLSVSGQATLDGTLVITLADGYVPMIGDTFVGFAPVGWPNYTIPPGFSYNPTNGTLTYTG